MSELFPTKFVADVGTVSFSSGRTVNVTLTVGSATVLNEMYSPADGQITIRGLRNVLEAAIYGELKTGAQNKACANVTLSISPSAYSGESRTLYASRLRNPRDPSGTKTILAAGDLVAVAGPNGLIAPLLYTEIDRNGAVVTNAMQPTPANGESLGGEVRIWVEHTACPERAVAVRFLNRYDVPQTMMTPIPLDVKPGFQDQTSLMYGSRVRYTVEQNDEYILRSGQIHSELEYASWSDLVTSRKAEVYLHGQWLPILVSKANYTQVLRSAGLNRVEISFKMADPRQGM